MPGITNPAEPFFKDGIWGWDGSAWRKLPLVWGYSDRWYENLGGTKSGAGTYSQFSTAVPAGYVYVLQVLSIRNVSNDPGFTQLRVYSNSAFVVLAAENVAKEVPLAWTGGALAMKEGDRVRVYMPTCLDADVVEAGVWGYKMAIAE